MKYLITWNKHRLGGRDTERYYISHNLRPTDILITSVKDISGAKAFDSRQNAKWVIRQLERRTEELGIIDIIEMDDKELFEARLKGK